MKTPKEIAEKYGFVQGVSVFSNTEQIESNLYLAMEEYAKQYYIFTSQMKELLLDAYKDGFDSATASLIAANESVKNTKL